MSYGDQWQPAGYGQQADQPYGHTGGQPPQGGWPQAQHQASAPPGYAPVSAQPGYPQQPYGQPAAPQPGPAQPGYQPAGYQHAGYQPAGYQPAGYQQPPPQWQPQHPGQPPRPHWQPPPVPATPPRPKSRAGLWVGLAAGATALVVIAGCGIAIAFMRSSNDTLASSPPALATEAPTEAVPQKPPSEVRLVRPERIGDRKRITQGEYATKATKAENQLKSSLRAGGSLVVGYYGTTDQKADQIYIVGTTIPGPMRKATFDKQFTESGPAIGGKPVTGTVDVTTPTSIGFTNCGQTSKSGMTVAFCAFSNQYDFVVVQWYNRKLSDDIKQEIGTIRTLIEK